MDVKDWVELVTLIFVIVGIIFRTGSITKEFKMIAEHQGEEISEVKKGLDKLSELIIDLTRVSGRLDRLEDRQLAEGKRLDEAVKRLWRRAASDD